jgi:hypothetical protein
MTRGRMRTVGLELHTLDHAHACMACVCKKQFIFDQLTTKVPAAALKLVRR